MSCAQGVADCNDVGGGVWAPPGLIIALVIGAFAVVVILLALVLWIRRNVKPRDDSRPQHLTPRRIEPEPVSRG